jgi:hypothetical protein
VSAVCTPWSIRETRAPGYTGSHGIQRKDAPYFCQENAHLARSGYSEEALVVEGQDTSAQGVADQIRLSAQAKLAHEITMVHFDRAGTD